MECVASLRGVRRSEEGLETGLDGSCAEQSLYTCGMKSSEKYTVDVKVDRYSQDLKILGPPKIIWNLWSEGMWIG